MIIYIDVLILVNFYVNYFLIKASAGILHLKIGTLRTVLSSFIGSLFSLTVFIDSWPFLIGLIKTSSILAVTLIAFGKYGYLKNLLITIFVSVVFGGIIYALSSFLNIGIKIINGSVYADISLGFLGASTIISYIVIRIIGYITDRTKIIGKAIGITVKIKDRQKHIEGIIDSGNLVTDYFSGKPVIICPFEEIAEIIPKDIKFRLIPYSTVNSNGLLKLITPDEVILYYDKRVKSAEVLIGVDDKSKNVQAIINPKLLV